MNAIKKSLSALSLFSGAGGMDLGFENAGFQVEWSNDFDQKACETYAKNFKSRNYFGLLEDYRNSLRSYSEIDCIFGGPPCQGFSVAGKMDLNDPRSKLVLEFISIVKELRPKSFVMENVPPLASLSKFNTFRRQLIEEATNVGYSVDLKVLSSALFGVPQERKRMFFVGVLGKHEINLVDRAQKYTRVPKSTFDAIKDLGVQGTNINPKTCNAKITLAANPIIRKSPYAGMLFNGLGRPIHPNRPSPTLPASMGGNKTPIIDERLYYGDGVDWVYDYHKHLINDGKPYGMYETPTSFRRLTIKEAARLHGFPDDFEFSGGKAAVYRQIGNAVPPDLAKTIGFILKEIFSGEKILTDQISLGL